MKKKFIIFVIISLIITITACSSQSQYILKKDGITYLDLDVYKELGYSTELCSKCVKITVENDKNQITAFVNKPYLYVNGQKFEWDSNNILIDKKVYVPVSVIDKLPDKEKIEEVISQ